MFKKKCVICGENFSPETKASTLCDRCWFAAKRGHHTGAASKNKKLKEKGGSKK